jgi:hypothetical protein
MDWLSDQLGYWINERYAIKLRKESGQPPPWSSDQIFNTVRFCNVHREDDRVTRWIRANWNYFTDPVWRFVLARMINWPDSLAEITLAGTPERAVEMLKQRAATGAKVFTSAYTISTCGRKMVKLDYILLVLQRVEKAQLQSASFKSLEDAHFWLSQIDGLGSFLSAQIIADMKNTEGHPLQYAPDWWTWSAPGPGSLRGLSWFFFRAPYGVTATNYWTLLDQCREITEPFINPEIPSISNQDFQNCLCEFSKWCKVKYNNGHVRNKYDPFLSASA